MAMARHDPNRAAPAETHYAVQMTKDPGIPPFRITPKFRKAVRQFVEREGIETFEDCVRYTQAHKGALSCPAHAPIWYLRKSLHMMPTPVRSTVPGSPRDTLLLYVPIPRPFPCLHSSVHCCDAKCPLQYGACQGRCRLSHAILRFSVEGSRAALVAASRSGFKVTTAIGDQLRVGPDQRRGCLSLAS